MSEEKDTSGRVPRRRKLLAIAAGVAVASLLVAAAATLGGVTIIRLAAENRIITGFEDGVTVTWGTPDYDPASGEFVIREMTLSPGDRTRPFPPEHTFELVLAGPDKAVLHRATVETPDSGDLVVTIASGVAVYDLTRVAVALHLTEVP